MIPALHGACFLVTVRTGDMPYIFVDSSRVASRSGRLFRIRGVESEVNCELRDIKSLPQLQDLCDERLLVPSTCCLTRRERLVESEVQNRRAGRPLPRQKKTGAMPRHFFGGGLLLRLFKRNTTSLSFPSFPSPTPSVELRCFFHIMHSRL